MTAPIDPDDLVQCDEEWRLVPSTKLIAWHAEDGIWIAEDLRRRGCWASGTTPDEALRALEDVIEDEVEAFDDASVGPGQPGENGGEESGLVGSRSVASPPSPRSRWSLPVDAFGFLPAAQRLLRDGDICSCFWRLSDGTPVICAMAADEPHEHRQPLGPELGQIEQELHELLQDQMARRWWRPSWSEGRHDGLLDAYVVVASALRRATS